VSEEVWSSIPGWEDYYEASNFGRIRSVKRLLTVPHGKGKTILSRWYGGKVLSPKVGHGNYLYVNLWRDNVGKMHAVHRCVLGAFSKDIPSHLVCNHIDSNRQNNFVDNLEFITQKENLEHARNLGSKIGRRPNPSSRNTLQTT